MNEKSNVHNKAKQLTQNKFKQDIITRIQSMRYNIQVKQKV